MTLRLAAIVLSFVVAAIFIVVGVRGEPRNATYIALGVVFLTLAIARYRKYSRRAPPSDLSR